MHMHRILICGRLALRYLSTLSHKRQDFRNTVIEHKMCVLIFCTTVFWNMSHCTQNSARYDHTVYWSSWQVPLLSSHFNETRNFSTDFRRTFKYKISRQSVQWGRVVPCRRTDGRTEWRMDRHDKAITHTLKFCERAWRETEHGHRTRGSTVTVAAGRLYSSISISGGSKRFISWPERLTQPVCSAGRYRVNNGGRSLELFIQIYPVPRPRLGDLLPPFL